MCARAQVLDNHELQGPGSARAARTWRASTWRSCPTTTRRWWTPRSRCWGSQVHALCACAGGGRVPGCAWRPARGPAAPCVPAAGVAVGLTRVFFARPSRHKRTNTRARPPPLARRRGARAVGDQRGRRVWQRAHDGRRGQGDADHHRGHGAHVAGGPVLGAQQAHGCVAAQACARSAAHASTHPVGAASLVQPPFVATRCGCVLHCVCVCVCAVAQLAEACRCPPEAAKLKQMATEEGYKAQVCARVCVVRASGAHVCAQARCGVWCAGSCRSLAHVPASAR